MSTSVHDQTGYSTFAIENGKRNNDNHHCQKCGRRHGSRKRFELQVQNVPERRTQSEQRRCRHGHPFRCRRHYHYEQRFFPTDLSRPIVTQSNSNHLSHQSHREILVDQLIQVKQVDRRRACTGHQQKHNSYGNRIISHKLSSAKSGRDYPEPIQTPKYDENSDETRQDAMGNSNELQHRAQQSVYLRENINNSIYRELHFATKYIVLKRLEEKNSLINHNRFKVDHCFRPLKLQSQILSVLHQNVPVISFTLIEQDRCQAEFVVRTPSKTPYIRCPTFQDSSSSIHKLASHDNPYSSYVLDRRSSPTSKQSIDPSSTNSKDNNMNTSAVVTESIPSTSDTIVKRDFPETFIVEQKQITSSIDKEIDPIDLPISIPSHSRHKQQQSRNASSPVLHQTGHRPSKDKRRDCRNETTVTVDVVKCRDRQQCQNRRNQPTHLPTENARNGHATRAAWSMPILVPTAHVSQPMGGYFQQYSPFLDLYQEPTMFMENYPHLDSDFRQQTSSDSHMDLPICNGLPSNDGTSPIWINDHDVTRNFPEIQIHEDTTKTTVTTTNETTVSSSNSDNDNENNRSSTTTLTRRAQLVDKVKQILNALQTNLLNYKEKLSHRQESHPIATSFPLPIQPPIYHTAIPNSLNANEIPIRSEFVNPSLSSNRIRKETNSSTMTFDSLLSNTSIQTTYSVSSTLPTMSKKKKTWQLFGNRQRIFPSSSFLSRTTVDVENEIQRIDSDHHHHRHQKPMKTRLRNCAKNVNANQKISDGFDDSCLPFLASLTTKKSSKNIHLRRKKPHHMSPSFMFVLQLLLLFSLINRFLLSHLFGTISNDFLSPAVTISSQSVTRPASVSNDATNNNNNNKVFFSFYQD